MMGLKDSIYFPITDSFKLITCFHLEVLFVLILILPFTWTDTGEQYLEIKILDCDILQFQVKNSPHNFELNEIYIYEQINSEKNMIYYYNLDSNKIKNPPSRLGLFINALNSSNVKLKAQKSSLDSFSLLIHILPSAGSSFQAISCIKYNPITKCYTTDGCSHNTLTYVTFTPENPVKNHHFCIKIHYTIQRHSYIDRLVFQAQNTNEELRTDIYTFKKSSSFDAGHGTFDEKSAWASRVNKSSNLSNDTVCFLEVLPADINVTFYWNIRVRKRDNDNKIKCMYSFKIPEMKTDTDKLGDSKGYDYSNNKITNVTFIPKIPVKNQHFCIKVHYSIQRHYYIDKLVLQAQNTNEEIKTNIYTFSKSSSYDTGQVTFDERSDWTSRIDKSFSWSNDTVCLLNILSSDINGTFYWNLLLKNRNNKNKIKCIYKFQLPVFLGMKNAKQLRDSKGSGGRTFLTATVFGSILMLSVAIGKIIYQ